MGDITIEGTIDVSGGTGENALNNTRAPALGGMGVAGGGQGGFGGVLGDGSEGIGDGGGSNDPNQNAQDLDSLLGKMLRAQLATRLR